MHNPTKVMQSTLMAATKVCKRDRWLNSRDLHALEMYAGRVGWGLVENVKISFEISCCAKR